MVEPFFNLYGHVLYRLLLKSWPANRSFVRRLVRLVGLEPTTYGFEIRNSIQLSYRRILLEEICVSIEYRFLTDCPV